MSDLPEQGKEIYLGDGLYASFDGWQVWLRAPRDGSDHTVALEPEVFQALLTWLAQHPQLDQHMRGNRAND